MGKQTFAPVNLFGITVQPTSSSGIAAILQGVAGQTADLSQWKDQTGNVLSRINARGAARFAGSASPALGANAANATLTTNSTSGGTLAAGTWKYSVTNVDANGLESPNSGSLIVTTTGSTSAITLAISAGPAGTAKRNIYRTPVNQSALFYYLDVVPDNTTLSYVDAGSVTLSAILAPFGNLQALLMAGPGPFDGTTSGFFSGTAAGTVLGINVPTGYTGNFLDIQLAGASKFSVTSAGVGTFASGVTASGTISAPIGIFNPTTTSSIALTAKGASSQTGDLFQAQTNASSAVLVRVDAHGRLGSNQIAAQNLPTVAQGAQGSSASLGTGSTDTKGTVLVTATSTPGALATVTYNASAAYTGVPVVVLTRQDAIAGEVYISATSTTAFTISSKTGIATGALTIGYLIIGG